MSYEFIDHTADVAFKSKGKTLEELFESCALATEQTMVKNLKKIKHKTIKSIKLKAKNPEELLFNFLQELIFLKDANLLLFSKFRIKIKHGKELILNAGLYGEKINPKKHELLVDVKAVTLHMYKVEKVKNYWRSFIILDV
ncbi:archease [Candidatus Woesearchaeota archaeon]|nr:archease [Candidatus Woesearchaeota archaeon]